MKYFAIFDKNVASIFQLQWDGNIFDMFLQRPVLCVTVLKWMSRIDQEVLTNFVKHVKLKLRISGSD